MKLTRDLNLEICRALGLEPLETGRILLDLRPNAIARIRIEHFVTEKDTQEITRVLRQFDLVDRGPLLEVGQIWKTGAWCINPIRMRVTAISDKDVFGEDPDSGELHEIGREGFEERWVLEKGAGAR